MVETHKGEGLILKTTHRPITTAAAALLFALALAASAQTSRHITTPKEALGFDIGDDYQLANESDRMKLVEIDKTEEGRPQYMAIITSPENQKNLAKYKDISRRLALAEGLSDAEAHAL